MTDMPPSNDQTRHGQLTGGGTAQKADPRKVAYNIALELLSDPDAPRLFDLFGTS
jgi:hypothetical protein